MFNFKLSLLANNTDNSSEKVHLLFIKILQHICLELFSLCKQCLICAYFSPDSIKIIFSLEKAILYFSWKQPFEKKKHLHLGWPEGKHCLNNFLGVNCSFKNVSGTLLIMPKIIICHNSADNGCD